MEVVHRAEHAGGLAGEDARNGVLPDDVKKVAQALGAMAIEGGTANAPGDGHAELGADGDACILTVLARAARRRADRHLGADAEGNAI